MTATAAALTASRSACPFTIAGYVCGSVPALEVGRPSGLEALLEAAAEVVAAEARQDPRHRRRGRDDADLGYALAVAALIRIALAQHRLLRPAPEPAEQASQ
jgi:hypothetical protein